ncbi:MAG: hypothetical protein ACRDRH_16060 [Pseudonocardia sp.]
MLTGTAGSAAVAATIAITHWRIDRRTTAKGVRLQEPFYLDSERVLDLYRVHGGTFQSKVNKTIQKSKGIGLLTNWTGGNYGVTVAEATEYIAKTEAIDIIRTVINGLDKEDYIVYVDLLRGEISPNRTLRKDVGRAGGERRKEVRLSDVQAFVAVTGQFSLLDGETNERATLAATYRNGIGTHQIHVAIAPKGLRGVVGTDDLRRMSSIGPFQVTCLGRVSWDSRAGCLVLRPTAIYW